MSNNPQAQANMYRDVLAEEEKFLKNLQRNLQDQLNRLKIEELSLLKLISMKGRQVHCPETPHRVHMEDLDRESSIDGGSTSGTRPHPVYTRHVTAEDAMGGQEGEEEEPSSNKLPAISELNSKQKKRQVQDSDSAHAQLTPEEEPYAGDMQVNDIPLDDEMSVNSKPLNLLGDGGGGTTDVDATSKNDGRRKNNEEEEEEEEEDTDDDMSDGFVSVKDEMEM